METYYDILQVSESATTEQIRKAYLGLAKQFHTDQLPAGASDAVRKMVTEKMQDINEAYEVLKTRRAIYDAEIARYRASERSRQHFTQQRPAPPPPRPAQARPAQAPASSTSASATVSTTASSTTSPPLARSSILRSGGAVFVTLIVLVFVSAWFSALFDKQSEPIKTETKPIADSRALDPTVEDCANDPSVKYGGRMVGCPPVTRTSATLPEPTPVDDQGKVVFSEPTGRVENGRVIFDSSPAPSEGNGKGIHPETESKPIVSVIAPAANPAVEVKIPEPEMIDGELWAGRVVSADGTVRASWMKARGGNILTSLIVNSDGSGNAERVESADGSIGTGVTFQRDGSFFATQIRRVDGTIEQESRVFPNGRKESKTITYPSGSVVTTSVIFSDGTQKVGWIKFVDGRTAGTAIFFKDHSWQAEYVQRLDGKILHHVAFNPYGNKGKWKNLKGAYD